MFLTLGLAGTFVAVTGLYGVRSYLVSRRLREFGSWGLRVAIYQISPDPTILILSLSIITRR
jgi:hypothetical protein